MKKKKLETYDWDAECALKDAEGALKDAENIFSLLHMDFFRSSAERELRFYEEAKKLLNVKNDADVGFFRAVELEEIDFSTPVLLENVLTTPSRDANGEMNEKKPTTVTKYSIAQQFFFRRGPKISGKAVVFLKAYLGYTDL